MRLYHGNWARKRASTEFVEEQRKGIGDVKLRVKCADNYTLEDFDSNIGLRQGRVLSPASLNVFIEDVLRKLDEPNVHPPAMLKRRLLGLLL
jgi:hypothetical protein